MSDPGGGGGLIFAKYFKKSAKLTKIYQKKFGGPQTPSDTDCWACGRSADATIASGSILFVGILPGQQEIVRDINPVKTNDSFHSFFIHVMIMQALSDDVLLSSLRQEVTTQPCGWCADGALSRLSSVRVEIRMKECRRFTRGVGQPEGLTRQSVIPLARVRPRLICN